MGDVLVNVDNVSKRFCRSLKRSLWTGLQALGSEIGGRRHGGGSGLPQSSADVQLRPDEFWSVKDVSFPDAPHTTSGVPNNEIPMRAGKASP